MIPNRWKVFQALPVEGQNSGKDGEFIIDGQSFSAYKNVAEESLNGIVPVVFESNEHMTGTYAMIDPAGRLFDNIKGSCTYSQPILKVGVKTARNQITQDHKGFLNRNGQFNWERD